MRFIPTKFHPPVDYIVGAALIAAPWIFAGSLLAASPWILGLPQRVSLLHKSARRMRHAARSFEREGAAPLEACG